MNIVQYAILLFVLIGINTHAQLPSKVKKLAGTWEYKGGSGFESWEIQGNVLVGHAFRINEKTGDTTKVEDMRMHKPGKNLLYVMETFNYIDGSLIINKKNFIADRRKMKFFNADAHIPYAIEYSFGFFSKKKLKVKIYYGPFDKPLKLILYKVN